MLTVHFVGRNNCLQEIVRRRERVAERLVKHIGQIEQILRSRREESSRKPEMVRVVHFDAEIRKKERNREAGVFRPLPIDSKG